MLHPKDLKPGDIYIIPGHAGTWSKPRHKVISNNSGIIQYELLDPIISSVTGLHIRIGFTASDIYRNLIAWKVQLVKPKVNHLPEWL